MPGSPFDTVSLSRHSYEDQRHGGGWQLWGLNKLLPIPEEDQELSVLPRVRVNYASADLHWRSLQLKKKEN